VTEETQAQITLQDWLEMFSEPALVVMTSGHVVACNQALSRVVGAVESNRPLRELVDRAEEDLQALLHTWARSKQPVIGSLSLHGLDGPVETTVYGGRLSSADDGRQQAHLLVRLIPRRRATEAFRSLTDQVTALGEEIAARVRAEHEILAERERYRTTLASIGDAVIATDETGRITFMNPVAEQLTGWSGDDAAGRLCSEIFAIVNERTRSVTESPIERVMAEGVIVGLANGTILIAKDGSERPIDDSAAPIRDEAGNIIGIVLIFRDISERRRSEQALRESEQRFRLMADTAPVLIWLADEQGACTYVNKQWLEFSGRRLEDELGKGWLEIVHPDDQEGCVTSLRAAFQNREPFQLEYRLRRVDGTYRWLLGHGSPRYLADGSFAGYIGSCTDITERHRAEQQLRSMNVLLEERVARRTEQLRQLTVRLTETEQSERRRLAQVLHDNLQQFIVAAKMRVEILDHQSRDPLVVENAASIRQLLDHALEVSRSLTLDLSPPVLYDAGLCAGMDWLARWMETQHRLNVEVVSDDDIDPLDPEIKVPLFLATRELLFNVVKHANVDRASVSIEVADGDRVRLEVTDEGRGFEPESLDARPSSGGFGLFSLRERVRYLGGNIEIESAPEQGTSVRIVLPRSLAQRN
jgi:PAS domain S-box-containing protein